MNILFIEYNNYFSVKIYRILRKKRYICGGKKGVNMLKYNKLSI